jgi:acetyl-CoA carboxylase alpha subunit
MANPEGYRKASFNENGRNLVFLVTIDTPGAYPDWKSEDREKRLQEIFLKWCA